MANKWVETTVGELCDQGHALIQTGPFGSQLHSRDYELVGVPVVPTEAIGRRRLVTDGLPRVSTVTAQRLTRHKLQAGDILFARRGAQATGLSAIVEPEQAGWLCGTGAILLRILTLDLDPGFFSFVSSSESSITWLKTHAVGAVMPNLNEIVLRGLPLLLPPLKEQHAIAHILGTLDDKIELNRRMNETLEAMARAIFKSWFVNFDPVRAKLALSEANGVEGHQPAGVDAETAALFPDSLEDSPLGKIPKGWKAGVLGEIADIVMGQSPPGESYNETGEGLPFYQGIRDFGFRFPLYRVYCTAPTRFAEKGDVLLSVRAPVGSLNVAIEHCSIGRGVAALRLKAEHGGFLYYLLKATQSDWEKFEAEGTVFGSVSKNDVHDFGVIVPPSELVEQFGVLVEPLDTQIEVNEQENQTLAAIRDALLPKLLSGEVRVKDKEVT